MRSIARVVLFVVGLGFVFTVSAATDLNEPSNSELSMCEIAPATCDIVLAGNGDGKEPPMPGKKKKKR